MVNIDKVIQNFRQSLITEITKPPRSPPNLTPPPQTRRRYNSTADGVFLPSDIEDLPPPPDDQQQE